MLTMRFDHAVEELAVVRDQQQRAGIILQPAFQPDDGIEVQVVGGLVQQQQVGAAHQRARHVQAHAPAAGEFAHQRVLIGGGEAQAMHQLRGARARVVAADGGVLRIQVGQLGAVVVARLRPWRCALPSRAVPQSPSSTNSMAGRSMASSFLRHMRHGQVGGHLEMAGIGLPAHRAPAP